MARTLRRVNRESLDLARRAGSAENMPLKSRRALVMCASNSSSHRRDACARHLCGARARLLVSQRGAIVPCGHIPSRRVGHRLFSVREIKYLRKAHSGVSERQTAWCAVQNPENAVSLDEIN
jgi:hypothetical protein